MLKDIWKHPKLIFGSAIEIIQMVYVGPNVIIRDNSSDKDKIIYSLRENFVANTPETQDFQHHNIPI